MDTQNEKELDTHTLQSDTNKYIHDKKVSLIDIILKEKNKFKTEKTKNGSFLKFFLVLIFILAIGAGFFIAYKKLIYRPKVIIEQEEYFKPFFYNDIIIPLSVNEGPLSEVISQNFEKEYVAGNFVYFPIIDDKRNIGFTEFINTLKIPIPLELSSAIEEKFLLSAYSKISGKNDLVFILKTNAQSETFAGMTKWENKMPEDLMPILPNETKENLTLIQNTAASDIYEKSASSTLQNINSTSSPEIISASSSVKFLFQDKLVNNINIRVLKNNNNDSIIAYGFFAGKYLIIATSEESFKNTINRLKISLE